MQVATRPTGALVSGKGAGDDTESAAQSPAAPDAAGGGEADGADAGGADRVADEGTKTGAGEARCTRARLLVIEDEPGIVDFLRRGLDSEGFVVEAAADGREGERRALSGEYDIVLLDLMLPGRSGLDVLGAIRRERPRMPVIVLTARGELEDRVAGLDAGAVDYVVKPFSVAELAARLRAHLRALEDASSTTLRGAGIEVDLLTRTVRREGRPVSLSMTEFELLAYMLRNEGQVLSREELLRAVWGEEQDRGRNVVDVYIGYLRRKLADQSGGSPIVTVRSVGYRFGEAG
jgi:DNA-binding response OmpR family regulator